MNHNHAVRALRARPISVLAILIAGATLGNALLVGCGKKADETATTSTETSTPSASTTPTDTATTPPAGGAASGDLGASVYAQRCALCHGPTGHGDGPAAAALNPKPRNHTDGSYMNKRTDAELLEVIRNGKGAMPAWGKILSEDEIQAVLKHVRTLAVPPYTS